jgi:predicted nucleotidyltransferase
MPVKKRPTPIKNSPKRTLRNEKDIAMDFAEIVHQKFDRMIKASVLFGSQAKDTAKPSSDIDVILIIDDASISWDLELISWYREELGKLIANQKYSRDLHINTIKLTTWWHDLLHGDPVVLNILRYGQALIDSGGFFNPLKVLLIQGKIKSTPEAVYAALQRAPMHIARSKASEIGAIEGVYWAMIDSAQAALIMAGQLAPSPEHIPNLIKSTFVDPGRLKMNSVKALKDIYILHKSISHGEISDIRGQDIDAWQETAEKFVLEMTRLIDQLIEEKTD